MRRRRSSSRNVRRATPAVLRLAAERIAKGGLVAFPTETVYGLGANALDEAAVAKIFQAKGRPADNPIIVHVSDRKMLRKIAGRLPAGATKLIARYWPGPLTLVLPKRRVVPSLVTAGLDTVAVRMPQGLARDLVRLAGVPVAAPSANLSGRPSPTTASHVAEDFPGLFVLDGGPTRHGVESTVVAFDPPRILRHGAITEEQLREFLRKGEPAGAGTRRARGQRASSRSGGGPPAESPGTKYTHYAPGRPLILFRRRSSLIAYAKAHPEALVLCPAWLAPFFAAWRVVPLGDSMEEIARSLFSALRTRRKGTELLVLAVPRRGLGRAVMDRLERAATRIV
ncbi:MAG: L-threonylcarbamoyladenylate synthase [Thermoanaerobaculia bacterium]